LDDCLPNLSLCSSEAGLQRLGAVQCHCFWTLQNNLRLDCAVSSHSYKGL